MDRMILMGVLAAGSVFAASASADIVKVADSIQEFSSVQGQDGWSYGWYADDQVGLSGGSGSLDTSNFQEFEHYDGQIGWWTHDAASAASGEEQTPFFLTVITSQYMHANSPIAGEPSVATEARWASRRWTSDIDGQVQVLGRLAKVDQGPLIGDGIDAYITIDGEVAFHYAVAGDDLAGTTYDLTLDVNEGSVIEFVIGGNESGLNDAVVFTSEIMGDVVPAPGAVALIGMGGALMGRRRR